MALCGALLGPCLDSFHSHYSVLHYVHPIYAGPITTAAWVPALFAVAGALIGFLYNMGDSFVPQQNKSQTWPHTLTGIGYFISQYWLSGYMSSIGVSHDTLLLVLTVLAAAGFYVFDFTLTGFVVSLLTAIGGPAIEVGLIHYTHQYSYLDPDFLNIPLWIAPVYFLGGAANGGLIRSFRGHNDDDNKSTPAQEPCSACNDSRVNECPNCDAIGYYISYNQRVECRCGTASHLVP